MVALGVLSFSKPTSYFTKLAHYSRAHSVTLYHFSPEEIDLHSQHINGLRYCPQKQEWQMEVFPIPHFIYDRCFYTSSNSRSFLKKIEELKQSKHHQFLGYGLPNKWIVYQALCKSDPTIQSFLPKTKRLTSSSFLLAQLKQQPKWLLKPIQGSQGRGLILVNRENGMFKVKEVKQPGEKLFTFTTTGQFQQWLHRKMKTNDYIFQPFLSLQSTDGYPFDIRILMQKDENGAWKEQIRVVRKGMQHHITSNLAGGGRMLPFSTLLHDLSDFHQSKVEKDIREIITHLPPNLEDSFQPLFELGIDLGMDDQQNLWILDINSKPGHKIVTMASNLKQQEIYEAPSRYSRYLAASSGNKMGVE
ncbi:YheC/YheD family endospore coat-associated protein [Sutcliffiella deserti]|uniref:YheC/YheD family endospore coat-associated protein n=1 Tax=Sutcliffiella deserti TaxID=2875501 RepID=UPI001CBDEFF1|nr:YheC/YheD family protein [Sutcliffiella deserti]